jgi:RNA polymerase sigma-70 factor (ECF subfamily)
MKFRKKKLLTDPTPEEQAAIIMRLQNGDDTVFDVLHKHFKETVWLYTKKYLPAVQERSEITSQVFIKLWHSRQKINDWGHLINFFYITTRNTCLTYLRDKENEDQNRKGYAEYHQSGQPDDNDWVYAQVLHLLLQDEVNNPLTAQETRVMQLSAEGKNIAEVAACLKIKIQTAYNHKCKALKKLRQYFLHNKIRSFDT